MQATMIAFDAFKEMRIGVYNGTDGEPITPPEGKGLPKTGWYILAIDASQSPSIEASEDEDDENVETTVDRTVFILWGLPKKAAAPAEKGTVKENPAPEAEEQAETKQEDPAEEKTEE